MLTGSWVGGLAGGKGGSNAAQPGIGDVSAAGLTVEALRQDGLLDEIFLTKEGSVMYPVGMK